MLAAEERKPWKAGMGICRRDKAVTANSGLRNTDRSAKAVSSGEAGAWKMQLILWAE